MPRDHVSSRAVGRRFRAGFKEAEARASGSLERPFTVRIRQTSFKEAEARASGSQSRCTFPASSKTRFKEAEARASGSHKTYLGYSRKFRASKRPRHVPRDHGAFRKGRTTRQRVLQRGRGTCLGITTSLFWSITAKAPLQRGRGTCLGITARGRALPCDA